MFLDSDDEWNKMSLAGLKKVSESDPDMIIFGYDVYSKANKITTKQYEETYVAGDTMRQHFEEYYNSTKTNYIGGTPWNKVYKKSLIQKQQIDFPELRRHQDVIFVLRYMSYVEKVAYVSDIIYKYNAPNSLHTAQKLPGDYIDIVERKYQLEAEIINGWNSSKAVQKVIEESYAFHIIKACESVVFHLPTWNVPLMKRNIADIMSLEKRVAVIQNASLSSYGSYAMILNAFKKQKYLLVIAFFEIKRFIQMFRN